jgi:hypothetical protein
MEERALMHAAYDEILDFVTSAPSLMQIANFTHSFTTQERVDYLLMAEERGTLSHEESHELREFQKAAYFIDQLKIRARRRLQGD